MKHAILVSMLGFMISCGLDQESSLLVEMQEKAISKCSDSTCTLTIKEITPFEWDTLHILYADYPYEDNYDALFQALAKGIKPAVSLSSASFCSGYIFLKNGECVKIHIVRNYESLFDDPECMMEKGLYFNLTKKTDNQKDYFTILPDDSIVIYKESFYSQAYLL